MPFTNFSPSWNQVRRILRKRRKNTFILIKLFSPWGNLKLWKPSSNWRLRRQFLRWLWPNVPRHLMDMNEVIIGLSGLIVVLHPPTFIDCYMKRIRKPVMMINSVLSCNTMVLWIHAAIGLAIRTRARINVYISNALTVVVLVRSQRNAWVMLADI